MDWDCKQRSEGKNAISRFVTCSKTHSEKMTTEIKFRPSDLSRVRTPHDNPLVITLNIHGINVCKVLVDGRSSANMLFWQTFKRM